MTPDEKEQLEKHFKERTDKADCLRRLESLADSAKSVRDFKSDDYGKRHSFSLTGLSASASVASVAMSAVSVSLSVASIKIRGAYFTWEAFKWCGAAEDAEFVKDCSAKQFRNEALLGLSFVGAVYNWICAVKHRIAGAPPVENVQLENQN